jgi:hypothetical protein
VNAGVCRLHPELEKSAALINSIAESTSQGTEDPDLPGNRIPSRRLGTINADRVGNPLVRVGHASCVSRATSIEMTDVRFSNFDRQ